MGSVVPGPHGSMQKNTAPAPQETVACRLAEAQESPHQQQSVGDLGPLPKDDPNVVIKKKAIINMASEKGHHHHWSNFCCHLVRLIWLHPQATAGRSTLLARLSRKPLVELTGEFLSNKNGEISEIASSNLAMEIPRD